MDPKSRGDVVRDRAKRARKLADDERVRAAAEGPTEDIHRRAAQSHEDAAAMHDHAATIMDDDDARPLAP
jgi:hypothetical protein